MQRRHCLIFARGKRRQLPICKRNHSSLLTGSLLPDAYSLFSIIVRDYATQQAWRKKRKVKASQQWKESRRERHDVVSDVQTVGEETAESPVRQESRENALSGEQEIAVNLDGTVIIEGPVVRLVDNRTTLDDPGDPRVRNGRRETTGSCGSSRTGNGSKEIADGRGGSGDGSSEKTTESSERFCGGSRGKDSSEEATKRICGWGAGREKTSERICGGSSRRDSSKEATKEVRGGSQRISR